MIAPLMRHQGRQFCGAASPASLTLLKVPASMKYQNRKLVGNCKPRRRLTHDLVALHVMFTSLASRSEGTAHHRQPRSSQDVAPAPTRNLGFSASRCVKLLRPLRDRRPTLASPQDERLLRLSTLGKTSRPPQFQTVPFAGAEQAAPAILFTSGSKPLLPCTW